MRTLTALADRISPQRRERIRRTAQRLRRPAIFGTLRRTKPLSDVWGRDRGTPLDRYYIERFLERERSAIRGNVLELLDTHYTKRFGVDVVSAGVLDIDPRNPEATVVADLMAADAVRSESFDCFILTQTLQFIEDVPAALSHVRRVLRPGGVVLCTVPAVSRLPRRLVDGDYWRFTAPGCRLLFEREFEREDVEIESHGNVLACIAFLMGIAAEELTAAELDASDPFFPLVVTVRARRAAAG